MRTSCKSPKRTATGAVQAFLERHRAGAQDVDSGRHHRHSSGDSDRRVANASLLIDAAGKRVARYDKIHLFDVTIPGRDEQYRESTHVLRDASVVIADTPVGRLGHVGVLRHALSRTVPGARIARRRVAGDAGRVHGADRARALGDAAAGAGHRESVLRGGAGADRHAHERPRDVRRFPDRRLLGPGAVAPGARVPE